MDVRPAVAAPFLMLAEAATNTENWVQTLANYGVAGIMLAWFMWRDKQDRDERERRHMENLTAQRRIEDAFRTTTDSLIVGLSSIKNLDAGYSELLARLKGNAAKDNAP